MDFGELNIDGLIDTGTLSSAIPEADLRKIRSLAPHTKWRPSTWVPNYGCQWTVRSTYCNSGIAIRSRWHSVQGKIHSHENFYKPFDRSLIPTTQKYHTRYASGKLELSLLFNAIEKRRSDIPKCHWTHINPSRNHTSTGKTNHNLRKVTYLHT